MPVVAALLSDEQRPKLLAETDAEYEALRERHAARQDTRTMLPIAAARAAATPIDWSNYHPPRPRMLLQQAMDVCAGPSCDHVHHVAEQFVKTFSDYSLAELRDYIDWQPFFNAWEMRGRFPDILNNPTTGEAARRLYEDAQVMLDQIIEGKWLRANGVFGLFPANQVDSDDIEVYTDESRRAVLTTLHQLRQQTEGRDGSPRKSLADFVAPKATGLRDYVGAFAVTAGLGSTERVAEFKKANDDYSAILLESLADRLAEAFAERLHERVRKEFWAYAPDEHLDSDGLISEKYARHPSRPGLSRVPRAHREADDLGAARRRGQDRHRAHREHGHVARRRGERAVLLAPGVAVLRAGPRRSRPGRGLRAAQGLDGRRGGEVALPEPGLPHRERVTGSVKGDRLGRTSHFGIGGFVVRSKSGPPNTDPRPRTSVDTAELCPALCRGQTGDPWFLWGESCVRERSR